MEPPQIIRELQHRWDSLSSPIRPNVLDIAWYRSHLPALPANRALLLGATPEIRDLFSESGYDAVVQDINKTNYEAMSALRLVTPGTETYMQSDWLEERPEFLGAFDAVVGDGVLLYLSFPSEPAQLMALLSRYLRPNGRLLLRQVFLGPLDPLKPSLERVARTERPCGTLVSSLLMSLIVQSAGISGTVDAALMGRLARAVTARLSDKQKEPFQLPFFRIRVAIRTIDFTTIFLLPCRYLRYHNSCNFYRLSWMWRRLIRRTTSQSSTTSGSNSGFVRVNRIRLPFAAERQTR